MRIRAIVALSLIIICLSIGCRNALSPNVDRNRAPETWLTAAPLDTLTARDPAGVIVGINRPSTIPYRFHMYWAGSDVDGAVVGYYWAVTETLPTPAEGTNILPPLPGPRTSQYRFTTRTDSTFTFNVSEYSPDRPHAFYIYAVDDKGRGDATPARFVFNALDRFPPVPVMDVSQGTGRITRLLVHGSPTSKDTVVAIRDTFSLSSIGTVPKDTIPSGARIDFAWHSEPTIAGGYAVRYKYKLDEPLFVEVDSSVSSKSYNTGLAGDFVNPGTKQWNLRAFDAAGGARELTRRFQVNWTPDTWFAGPDSNLVPRQHDLADPIDDNQRYLKITNWKDLPTAGNSFLNCDSLYYWPSERKPNKTFWEIYRDKLYLRAENDTIDMNGIVVIQPGGTDLDSPYRVNVDINDPDADTTVCNRPGEYARVLRPGPANGSPVAFRYQYTEGLDPNVATTSTPSQSALFPFYDAASPFFQHIINGYTPIHESGKVYLVLRAIDGDGFADARIADTFSARAFADAIDKGLDTDPNHVKLRQQLIMTFYVNRVPYFDLNSVGFFPKPPEYNGGVVASSPDRILRLKLPAIDPDPYDPATKPASGGGPSASTVLRTQVTVTGTYDAGGGVLRDTSYTAPQRFDPNYNIDLTADAPYITGSHLRLSIELCDCANCETTPGSGRCIRFGPIPVDVTSSASVAPNGGSMGRPTGTIPSATSSRSLTP